MIKSDISTLMNKDPLELASYLRSQYHIQIPDSINTKSEQDQAVHAMNYASSYLCYFREMETIARNLKRKRKREGCTPEEADNLLGCEEVFETFKKIAEHHYEQISKMMTMKRLMLDEAKILGHAI